METTFVITVGKRLRAVHVLTKLQQASEQEDDESVNTMPCRRQKFDANRGMMDNVEYEFRGLNNDSR